MKKLKIDFKIDYISNELIPLDEYRKKLRDSRSERKSNNCFISEIADFYYKEKYNINIVEVLSKFHDIPKCPISGNLVCYNLSGSIEFGQFSSTCSQKEINQYVADNNESFKEFVEKMKTERIGSGNPMFGKKAWNDGVTKFDDERMMRNSINRIGRETSDESKQKQSDSAKIREVHGHTGHKHSEESKQIMREKTIARFKSGDFAQLYSLPAKKTYEFIEEIIGKENVFFEKEFPYGLFSFDFLIYPNTLIEVQGDYFHCNPNTRHAIPKNDMQKNNLERDKRKRKFVNEKNEYTLIEFWENDILNNPEKTKEELWNLKKLLK